MAFDLHGLAVWIKLVHQPVQPARVVPAKPFAPQSLHVCEQSQDLTASGPQRYESKR